MTDLYHQRQFHQLRKNIFKRHEGQLISNQLLMLKQNQLLEQCHKKLERRRTFDTLNNFSLSITNISSINNITQTEDSFRNRFTQEFQNSILNSAIKQIKMNCSDQTIDTITNYIVNNKSKEYEDLKKQYEKKVKECEELSVLIIIKQKDISFLERDLVHLKTKEEFLDEERRKFKKKMQNLDQKQQRLHNTEMSLIFKEKLNLQGKRRYERQKDFNDGVLLKIEKIYSQLNQIWQKIFITMEKHKCNCPGDSWKSQVMRKCKLQLLQQRKILQAQEKQIQSEYQTMRSLTEQIKKVLIMTQPQTIKKVEEPKGK